MAVLFFAVMWLSALIAPEGLLHDNNLSSFGVLAETAVLFNAGLVAVGLLDFVAAWLWRRGHSGRLAPVVFAFAGAGAIAAGIVNVGVEKNVHAVVSGVGFLGHVAMPFVLGAGSANAAIRLLSYLAGFASIAFLVVWVLGTFELTDAFDRLGMGGTQVLLLLPLVVWTFGFGGYLMAVRRGGGARPGHR
jgi:hypothetical membrane protein